LAHFEKIAKIYDAKVLRLDDLKIIEYEFMRVHNYSGVQRYLDDIRAENDAEKEPHGDYPYFRQVYSQVWGKLAAEK
jgi:hypothetical protein